MNQSGVTDVDARVLNSAVTVGFLIGDANGDGSVHAGDAMITRNVSGSVTTATNFRADYKTDGVINSGEATIVRNTSGHFVR